MTSLTTQPQPIPAPPGPTGLANAIRHMSEMRQDISGLMIRLGREYGPVVSFQFGPISMYVISTPETMYEVLVEQAAKFYKTKMTKAVLKPMLGDGLIISDGEFWRRQRKLTQPAFHAKRIEGYADTMVKLTEQAMHDWQTGQTRPIDQDMMELTLNIVTETLFGTKLSEQDTQNIRKAVEIGQDNSNYKFTRVVTPPAWVPTARNKRGKWAIQAIEDVVLRVIAERRASQEDKGDLLSMLLLASDGDGDKNAGMTDQQARDEAVTLMLAGHETTSNTLTWAWYLLSQHPEIEAKLHGELDRVLGGRTPTLADLAQLPYTDAIIKETLRLYPAAYLTAREAIEDVVIGGYQLKAGREVIVPIYALHRDPRYYDAPEAFRPDRWLENGGTLEKRLPKGAYLPFGMGPRVCIGNMFASMEARLLLATIARRWQLRLAPDQQVAVEPLVTLCPKYGMRMQVEGR
ncbi:MAG: cytochrome P450 [Anaerolineae bacterium]|nr:cytochrome P450 [Anaerolineae bacterium]